MKDSSYKRLFNSPDEAIMAMEQAAVNNAVLEDGQEGEGSVHKYGDSQWYVFFWGKGTLLEDGTIGWTHHPYLPCEYGYGDCRYRVDHGFILRKDTGEVITTSEGDRDQFVAVLEDMVRRGEARKIEMVSSDGGEAYHVLPERLWADGRGCSYIYAFVPGDWRTPSPTFPSIPLGERGYSVYSSGYVPEWGMMVCSCVQWELDQSVLAAVARDYSLLHDSD